MSAPWRGWSGDHPRSRGVYPGGRRHRLAGCGSSPLARGLPGASGGGGPGHRIIPARAGFTGGTTPPPTVQKDHPRSRGVYRQPPGSRRASPGSSPLARGLHKGGDARPVGARIIPARAGFTIPSTSPRSVRWDHPRSRGVYLPRWACEALAEGSSPLARGLPGPLGSRSSRTRDHPRSRGVYRRKVRDGRIPAGSSPLARGLPRAGAPRRGWTGIIPARAGFTTMKGLDMPSMKDHPRSRGVYPPPRRRECTASGSSPLARGLRAPPSARLTLRGIIPARAGFTAWVTRMGVPASDHPRSRGVY